MKFIAPILSLFLLLPQTLLADTHSPAGLWQSTDDKTNQPRSLIRIIEQNGKFSAVIEKGLLPTDTDDAICDKCTDERKDQPVIGMTIMRNMVKDGGKYAGGRILDPENGKTYKCKMMLNQSGNLLEVRGFIGFSLLGRSQTWKRIE